MIGFPGITWNTPPDIFFPMLPLFLFQKTKIRSTTLWNGHRSRITIAFFPLRISSFTPIQS